MRRVPGRNLWLWYTVAGDVVTVVGLTADPPARGRVTEREWLCPTFAHRTPSRGGNMENIAALFGESPCLS